MPFNKKSIKALRSRVGLSQNRFARDLGDYVARAGLEQKNYFTPQTINNWESGRSVPNTGTIDLLYLYAKSKGCKDLEFYKRP